MAKTGKGKDQFKMLGKAVGLYNGRKIDFTQDMINLTDMWRACESQPHKKPALWVKRGTVQDLIKELGNITKKNLKVAYATFYEIKRGRNGGTFAHWQLAIAYAQFLSPEFQLFCGELVRQRFEELADPMLGVMRAEQRAINIYKRWGKSPDWVLMRREWRVYH